MSNYTAAAITVLPGLEAVRRRPAMYVGSTGPDGVQNLAIEVLQNAVDEALGGHATRLVVALDDDGTVTVEDDGRGIPVDPHPSNGLPAAEVVVTTLHSGSKFGGGAYERAGGLHGVGLACVNALSERLELTVRRDGGEWFASFVRGQLERGLTQVANTPRHGTRVRFRPDPALFGEHRVDEDALRTWLHAQACLCPGLEVSLGRWTYVSTAGLPDLVQSMTGTRERVHLDPIPVSGVDDGVSVRAALVWTRAYTEDVAAFVNHVATPQGGTHVDGLRAATLRAVEAYAQSNHLLDPGERLGTDDVLEGLVAVLSVRMEEPEFEGQTKSLLTSGHAGASVRRILQRALPDYLNANPIEAAAIVGRAVEAARARAASRRASERARYERVDVLVDKEVFKQQFGIRSKNWHDSARWITDETLLGMHGGSCTKAEDAVVLDICCGSGVVGASFKGRVKKVIGLDLTPEMIALAKTRLDEVVQADVYDIPFPEGTFDVVCNREVLHLLPQPERPVAQVFRVLKPGGQFVVGQLVPYSAVDAPWFFRIVRKKQPLFVNNFLDEDFRALLTGAGFVNLTVQEYVQWEDIDTWIHTWETPMLHRHQIRDLYHHAPAEVRAVHPFEISPTGAIRDGWRWCVYSCYKPS